VLLAPANAWAEGAPSMWGDSRQGSMDSSRAMVADSWPNPFFSSFFSPLLLTSLDLHPGSMRGSKFDELMVIGLPVPHPKERIKQQTNQLYNTGRARARKEPIRCVFGFSPYACCHTPESRHSPMRPGISSMGAQPK
jgi:hypothetical protein